MLVERNSSEICPPPHTHTLTSPPPPPHSSHQSGCSHSLLHNPTGRASVSQEFLWERTASYPLCGLLLSFQLLPERRLGRVAAPRSPPAMQTLGSREPQTAGSPQPSCLRPGSCPSSFLRFSHPQPVCAKMSRLRADGVGSNCLHLGQYFWSFQVSVSLSVK